jgi:uncharacterized protein (TIGR00255 family)
MIRSMTGFGRYTGQDPDWTFTWEVRSVNGRHLDLKWRTPMFLRGVEAGWEKVVRRYASRGRVDCFLHLRITRAELMGVSLNRPYAQAMLDQVDSLARDLGQNYAPDLNRLLSLSQLWDDDFREPDPRLLQSLEHGLQRALEDWNQARAAEGEDLAADLRERLQRLNQWVEQAAERSPKIKEDRFQALEARIQATMERYSLELEPDRVLQEVAVLSDKLDVSEEITRLRSHLARLGELLDGGGEAGKRLDFTLQECFREINTLGNKIQDAEVSRTVVDFKAELEKCREQVQNVE